MPRRSGNKVFVLSDWNVDHPQANTQETHHANIASSSGHFFVIDGIRVMCWQAAFIAAMLAGWLWARPPSNEGEKAKRLESAGLTSAEIEHAIPQGPGVTFTAAVLQGGIAKRPEAADAADAVKEASGHGFSDTPSLRHMFAALKRIVLRPTIWSQRKWTPHRAYTTSALRA